MKIIKSMLLLLTGVAFGVGFVLSCGDDSPRHIDAATSCDCPASEPPIAGRVTIVESDPVTIAAGATESAATGCGTGQQLLSGACSAVDPTSAPFLVLRESILEKPPGSAFVWTCLFQNSSSNAVRVKATALCLKPSM